MQATATITTRKRHGICRPVLHVLTEDGRVTEFKDRVIVLPDADNTTGGGGIFAQLVTRDGTPYVSPDGEPVLLPVKRFEGPDSAYVAVPVTALSVAPDPDKMLSWKEVKDWAGVSMSQAKRMVTDGKLPKPVKMGKRKVGFRQGDVMVALAKLSRPRT